MNASSSSSPDAPADPQTALALMLLGRSKPAGVRNSTGNIDVRGLADQFTSLLSDTSVFWSTRHSTVLVQPNSVNDPVLFNILLYSIINGFAGLEGVPSASVLGVLRENRGFFSHISKLILSGPDSMAKPIVDNLFPAALQAGDAEAVALLLQATQNHRGISIDLNKSVFRVLGKVYTPLELAVDSGSTEVIRLMFEAGADPNRKFCEENRPGYITVLFLVISKKNVESEYPMLDVVRMLLNHGAEIDAESIRGAVDVSGNNPMVLKELIQGLHPSKHAICFSSQNQRQYTSSNGDFYTAGRYRRQFIVEDMIRLTDNSVVTSLVKDVVKQCTSTNCKKCILDNPEAVNNMVLQAAKRDNLELVEFLAQYATSLHEALAGAVKSGNYELITFLLDNGARADGPAVRVVTNNMMSTEPSTPLAEAIRQGDDKLVHTLADYGAWRRLDDEDHWNAAMYAAAGVGSVRYLEEALCSVTPARVVPSGALEKALTKGNSQIALALLRAGAPASGPEFLSLALGMRNKSVVDALLDCGVYVHRDVLGQAAEWGDVDIIDALVSRGADLDAGDITTALAAAVASQNRQLVDYILDLGANPGAKAWKGRSPLGEAIKNKDYPMMEYLLSKGATPADTSAFLTATGYDQEALVKLSSAFKQKYPLGLKGFGTELLAKAIGANDAIGVRFLLDLKVDTTSMVDAGVFDRRHLETFDFGRDHMRMSPLGFAILNTKTGDIQVVDLLLRAGAPANAIAAEYLEQGKGHQEFRIFKTLLLLAIETRNTPTVNLLLENGADINYLARWGVLCTPLQEACKIGSYDLVELLLRKGAHVNSPAAKRWGGTALQFAAQSGSLKIVELLLLNNADPHAPASEFGWGGTAFEFAAEFGRYHVLLHLWKISPPEGFTAAILHSARDRAEENGHRGCVDFITQIMRDTSFERLF